MGSRAAPGKALGHVSHAGNGAEELISTAQNSTNPKRFTLPCCEDPMP